MEIKNLELKNKYILAPMVEVNDIAFRILCKKSNAALCFTGMINPLSKQKLNLKDKPALQLFSRTSKGIKEFVKKHDKNVSLWDFNLGCPAKTARKLGFGVFMHHDLKEIKKIIHAIKTSTKKPVTIKLRKSSHALKIAKLAESLGVDAISIHPRTQSQAYSGKPDLEFAEKIKSSVAIPVIYSGNINKSNHKQLLKKFDFLMIGREAIGRPNIFSELTQTKSKNFNFLDYLKLAQKYKLKFKQIKFQAIWFTKSLRNSTKHRNNLVKLKTIKQIKEYYENEIY